MYSDGHDGNQVWKSILVRFHQSSLISLISVDPEIITFRSKYLRHFSSTHKFKNNLKHLVFKYLSESKDKIVVPLAETKTEIVKFQQWQNCFLKLKFEAMKSSSSSMMEATSHRKFQVATFATTMAK
jgi:hypothetical protein